MLAILAGDPGAAVGDIQHQLGAGGPRAQVDGTALGRVLDGVRHQVLEDQTNLAAIGDERHVLDAHVEAHPLRQQSELLVLQNLLHERPEAKLGGLEADAGGLPGAEGEEVLDHALQLDAVLAQDGGHLALVGIELSHGPVHQELGALADVCERGLQLMRYVPEEPIALVRQLEQTLPQPLELAAEALEIVGARHRDRIGEGALAELADGSVELAQRPADAEGEDEDGDERERQEGRRLPQEAIACVERLRFECRHLAVDLGIALLGDPLDERRQLRETARKIGGRGGAAARRSAHDGEADTPLQPSELLERLCRVGGGVQAQLLARRAQERILRAVKLEERGIREHLIQARRALEGSHLREQLLAGARARDALDHDLLAPVRQITDLEHRGQDGDQERHGDERQPDQHQAAQ